MLRYIHIQCTYGVYRHVISDWCHEVKSQHGVTFSAAFQMTMVDCMTPVQIKNSLGKRGFRFDITRKLYDRRYYVPEEEGKAG